MESNGPLLLHERIEQHAYHLWKQRGCLIGSPEEDWYKAERELTALESPILAADFVPISAPSRVLKELPSMLFNRVKLKENG